MAIKTKAQILKQLISNFISEQDKVTYMGKSSVARALLSATAALKFELWNDIYQAKRRVQVSTAEGSDLDLLAERHGLTRDAASKASCILLINGTTGTVILSGTIVKSDISEVQYQTLSGITLGNSNPDLSRPVYSNVLGDIVLVESLTEGIGANVGPNELTILDPSIDGVDEVTNLIPSVGGADSETDAELRERLISQLDLLNQGTSNFYKSLAREADATVLKALPVFNPSNMGIDIHLVKNSLGTFSAGELLAVAEYIYPKQRALNKITCYNATFKSIEVECYVRTKTGSTFANIYTDIAEKIAAYVDVEKMDFGQKVKYYEILDIITDIEGVLDINTDRLLVNNGREDIQCSSKEIPRFTSLKVVDQLNTEGQVIQQTYLVI